MGLTQVNIHSHLRGKGAQGRQGTAGQNDAANTLILQVLHAEARRETPITQNVSWKTQMNKHIESRQIKGTCCKNLKQRLCLWQRIGSTFQTKTKTNKKNGMQDEFACYQLNHWLFKAFALPAFFDDEAHRSPFFCFFWVLLSLWMWTCSQDTKYDSWWQVPNNDVTPHEK